MLLNSTAYWVKAADDSEFIPNMTEDMTEDMTKYITYEEPMPSTNYAAAASITISLCKHVTSKMSAVISAIATYLGWKIDSSLPIKLETRAAVKYKRQLGSYYLSTKQWWPSVQIGRVEYWYYQTAYQPTYTNGPWVPHHKDNIPNSAENNYSSAQTKDHYYDSNWIINKVKELSNSGEVYIDIFG